MGRGPKATTSRVYCMARAALKDWAGAHTTRVRSTTNKTAELRSAGQPGAAVPTRVVAVLIIDLFLLGGLYVASGAPARRCQYSGCTALPWARRKCTCSAYQWSY